MLIVALQSTTYVYWKSDRALKSEKKYTILILFRETEEGKIGFNFKIGKWKYVVVSF